MLKESNLHNYQKRGINHMLDHDQANLWLFMSAGKTIITLSAIVARMDNFEVYGTLVLAPLRVAQATWEQEAKKWEHTKHLSFSLMHGNVTKREMALNRSADIYLINYEGLAWLADHIEDTYLSKGRVPPFNMIVYDESSKLKNSTSNRHKALRSFMLHIPYRYALTGTPAANGLIDVFGQQLAVDAGERLGTSIYHFKNKFFNKTGYQGYTLEIKKGAKARITEVIAPVTLQMNLTDYLELPPVIFNDVRVELPSKYRKEYEELEKELFLELDNGATIDLPNTVALNNKLLQFAGGSIYTDTETREWYQIHKAKMDALDDIVEESGHKPILLMYQYQHQKALILKKYPHAKFIKSGMSTNDFNQVVEDWNNNKVEILVAHPASCGFGLNLQGAKDSMMVWYGLGYSLELYEQACARLVRQGISHNVVIHRIICNSTMDEVVKIALESKATSQEALREAVDIYRKSKLKIS